MLTVIIKYFILHVLIMIKILPILICLYFNVDITHVAKY